MVRGAMPSVLRERATLRSAQRGALDGVVRRGAHDSVWPAVESRRCGAFELRRGGRKGPRGRAKKGRARLPVRRHGVRGPDKKARRHR